MEGLLGPLRLVRGRIGLTKAGRSLEREVYDDIMIVVAVYLEFVLQSRNCGGANLSFSILYYLPSQKLPMISTHSSVLLRTKS